MIRRTSLTPRGSLKTSQASSNKEGTDLRLVGGAEKILIARCEFVCHPSVFQLNRMSRSLKKIWKSEQHQEFRVWYKADWLAQIWVLFSAGVDQTRPVTTGSCLVYLKNNYDINRVLTAHNTQCTLWVSVSYDLFFVCFWLFLGWANNSM